MGYILMNEFKHTDNQELSKPKAEGFKNIKPENGMTTDKASDIFNQSFQDNHGINMEKKSEEYESLSSVMHNQELTDYIPNEETKARYEIRDYEYDFLCSEVFDRFEDEFNIEFDIDNQLEKILEQFTAEKWGNMDDAERFNAVDDFVRALGRSLELEDIPEIIIYDDSSSDEYGSYRKLDNTIALNKSYFNDSIELVDTIAHEMRHAYQNYRAELCETFEDLLYKFNIDNYPELFTNHQNAVNNS